MKIPHLRWYIAALLFTAQLFAALGATLFVALCVVQHSSHILGASSGTRGLAPGCGCQRHRIRA